MMRFNHSMIFFKLSDKYKISDINHNNYLGQIHSYYGIYSKVCYKEMEKSLNKAVKDAEN